MESLKSNVQTIMEKCNVSEQYSRKNNLRVFGIRDNKNETIEETEKKIVAVISSKLGVADIKQKIDVAHRVGRYVPNADRAIIVRFARHASAQQILIKRRALKGSGVTIAEDLTAMNAQRLKKLKELDNAVQAWSKGGELFVKGKNDLIIKYAHTEPLSAVNVKLAQRPTRLEPAGRNRRQQSVGTAAAPLTSTPTETAGAGRGRDQLTPVLTPVQGRLVAFAERGMEKTSTGDT
ncbi:hypothetical protein EGW08_014637 [Elysia chlorotica]|uniref:L1 transposable element RRM domain-containing protein n=1 Tax=Elysia chlorotica TaxID=188477 RepID=A0A3S0ZH89_ELYCH|nr:hypothetical protein EGW08_014637 [Elysia chlorotica]